MTTSIQAKAIEATAKFFAIAAKKYGVTFNYKVLFDLRGTCAGQARYTRVYGSTDIVNIIIRYNPVLLTENVEDFLARTVPHEVAHIVAQKVFGSYVTKVNHGQGWKNVMAAFGCDATRCHDYDVSNARVRNVVRVDAKCACMTHQITKKAATRISMGAKYTCRKCKTAVLLAPVVKATPAPKVVTTPKVVSTKKAVAPKVVTAKSPVVATAKGNNLVLAKEIYVNNITATRKEIIEKMIESGIKAGTAGAYYNKFANHNGV